MKRRRDLDESSLTRRKRKQRLLCMPSDRLEMSAQTLESERFSNIIGTEFRDVQVF